MYSALLALIDVAKEFKAFRKQSNIWQSPSKQEFSYLIADNGIKKLKNGFNLSLTDKD